MANTAEAATREKRQARVSKAVWGGICLVMGTLFTLNNLERIDMTQDRRYLPGNAVDGDSKTRWSSAFHDPQWIAIDLGAPQDITRVKLDWEGAYAKAYQIDVSEDGSRWTTVKEVTDGDGGSDEHDVTARGRYVRMSGTTRSTPYGYSLWEFEVYGPLPGPLLSRGKIATASSKETAGLWFLYWPVLFIGAGLPALIAPKDGGDQVLGLVLTSLGVFLQAQKLLFVSWTFAQIWPILLMAVGFVLVAQALRQMGGRPESGHRVTGGDAGPGPFGGAR